MTTSTATTSTRTTSSRPGLNLNGLSSTSLVKQPQASSSPDAETLALPLSGVAETVAAELTQAVYPVVLRHGNVDHWASLELDLWNELSAAVQRLGRRLLHTASGPNAGLTDLLSGRDDAKSTVERVVTYFGIDENGDPTFHRFVSFKVIGGPGPNEDSGLASIIPLAHSNTNDPFDPQQKFHTATSGGAPRAMEAALHYLDAYYDGGRWRKVESDIHA